MQVEGPEESFLALKRKYTLSKWRARILVAVLVFYVALILSLLVQFGLAGWPLLLTPLLKARRIYRVWKRPAELRGTMAPFVKQGIACPTCLELRRPVSNSCPKCATMFLAVPLF